MSRLSGAAKRTPFCMTIVGCSGSLRCRKWCSLGLCWWKHPRHHNHRHFLCYQASNQPTTSNEGTPLLARLDVYFLWFARIVRLWNSVSYTLDWWLWEELRTVDFFEKGRALHCNKLPSGTSTSVFLCSTHVFLWLDSGCRRWNTVGVLYLELIVQMPWK